jgi:hypothetical protein
MARDPADVSLRGRLARCASTPPTRGHCLRYPSSENRGISDLPLSGGAAGIEVRLGRDEDDCLQASGSAPGTSGTPAAAGGPGASSNAAGTKPASHGVPHCAALSGQFLRR